MPDRKPSAVTTRTPIDGELSRLIEGVLADPHRVLGPHDGVVRAWRPGAVSMRLLPEGGTPVEMEQIRPEGVFEAPAETGAGYRLEARYQDGTVFAYDDPYRFWPTLGDVDLHLIGEGNHRHLWRALGAHVRTYDGVHGTAFAVWAPSARSVRVVGDFNQWDGRVHPMRVLGSSGIWEIFVPGVGDGDLYKFEILSAGDRLFLKADPMAFRAQHPAHGTASMVTESRHEWHDQGWMATRDKVERIHAPISIYELHVGSWRKSDDNHYFTYRELAETLPDYLIDMGFTHVELMPVAEHPYDPSWGYQVSSYYAPTARFGTPDDFRYLIDALHSRGIGVLVDWVPAHFPSDEWSLGRFDGTALYEHDDPRLGFHPDWGTFVFNFGRHEVRNFLIANALFWLEEFHADGLRVDAVASMLYRDYSRKEGEWLPNQFGGRENLEAVGFLKQLNEAVYGEHPGIMMVAEESTAWPGVSRPTYLGGLGFGFKWNMGWMHDTLDYFSKDPIHRRYHHNDLTFGLLYAWSENFILPLSHDEVVHGKASLLSKMPGDYWQKRANLRSLYAWMWAHPGKKLLFMGGELAQDWEWSHERSIDWASLHDPGHRGVQDLVRALNHLYLDLPQLWQRDDSPEGFRWIDASDVENNVLSFLRYGDDGRVLACVANLSPVVRHGYRVGLPEGGDWREVLNTDALEFGGSGVGNAGRAYAADRSWHGLPFSAELVLPPLAVVWLTPGG
ncbi:MAG TPA: 1,4-alpha-glucan branching protein GlgB [Acidimicrobiales bacterium]|nr:1,4-alpha-glucan branching protein GlgB [Acidimicrobiales bacterium]